MTEDLEFDNITSTAGDSLMSDNENFDLRGQTFKARDDATGLYPCAAIFKGSGLFSS